MLCGVRDVVVVLSQKMSLGRLGESKRYDYLHTKSRVVVSVKSAITAIKVISYVYSNHFGAIFSPTKVAKVFFSAKIIFGCLSQKSQLSSYSPFRNSLLESQSLSIFKYRSLFYSHIVKMAIGVKQYHICTLLLFCL